MQIPWPFLGWKNLLTTLKPLRLAGLNSPTCPCEQPARYLGPLRVGSCAPTERPARGWGSPAASSIPLEVALSSGA